MYKLIAIYRTPISEDARAKFDAHFQSVHAPLCLGIPGVKELRVNKVFGTPSGTSHLCQVIEIIFGEKEAWQTAMKSPQMLETGKDAMSFAGDLVSVHFAQEAILRP